MLTISIKNNILYIEETGDNFNNNNINLPLPFTEFDKLSVIGGSFGKVYNIKYKNESYILKIFKDKKNQHICDKEYNFLVKFPEIFGEAKSLLVEDNPALLMKEAHGSLLSDDQFKYLSVLELLEVWQAILKAALLLNGHRVVHLDLKLDNIFYDFKTKIATIIDFGSAKMSGDMYKNIETTLTYAPPEYFLNENELTVDSKMDVYSLGVIAYELFGKFSTQEIISLMYPNLKNPIQLTAKFIDNRKMYLSILLKNIRWWLAENAIYHDDIISLFEIIHLTQSEKIDARPTLKELYDQTKHIIASIQSKQYYTLNMALKDVNIDNSAFAFYTKFWLENANDVDNILNLFINYIERSKNFISNRHYAVEIETVLNSSRQYYFSPLNLIEKIYDAISENPNFNRSTNGSAVKRLAYAFYKLSPPLQAFKSCTIANYRLNMDWRNHDNNNNESKHGRNFAVLLAQPRAYGSPDACQPLNHQPRAN